MNATESSSSSTVHSVALIGISGYAGMELAKLLAGHRQFRVRTAVSERWKGQRVGAHIPVADALGELEVSGYDGELSDDVELAFLATPAEASIRWAKKLLVRGVRVVDLSGAFRLKQPADYAEWYGFEHPEPALLEQAVYALPELDGAWLKRNLRDAKLVANPGCYPTATLLALAPLVKAGLIASSTIFVDGKSGVTGAGRQASERLLFNEAAENLSPYRVGNHQHTPEMERYLEAVTGQKKAISFTPHLIPVRRGLLISAYAEGAPGANQDAIAAAYASAYAKHPLVKVVAPGDANIAKVVGSPFARVGAHYRADRQALVAIGVIDNLMKGAASQAFENGARMLGVDPWPGLSGHEH